MVHQFLINLLKEIRKQVYLAIQAVLLVQLLVFLEQVYQSSFKLGSLSNLFSKIKDLEDKNKELEISQSELKDKLNKLENKEQSKEYYYKLLIKISNNFNKLTEKNKTILKSYNISYDTIEKEYNYKMNINAKDIFHNYNKPNSELELKDVCS